MPFSNMYVYIYICIYMCVCRHVVFLLSQEEHSLMGFDKRVLRRMFEHKKNEETGG
jgi:hypothetical protein